MYLPEDPTIPRPDQYSDLSIGDLLLVCEFWRFGALHWLRREKPDHFRHVFDNLPARRDTAVESMRALIIKGEAESARSAYYFAEHRFAYLGQIVVRACKDFGVDPQPVHEFLDYRDADPMSAIRAVGLLEWRLKGELSQEATANPEHKDTEPVVPPSEQPAEDPRPSEVAAGDGAPTPATKVKKRGAGRPPLSAEEQRKANKFCEGLNESALSCPAYSKENGVDPAVGKRWRDWYYRRQKRSKDAVNNE